MKMNLFLVALGSALLFAVRCPMLKAQDNAAVPQASAHSGERGSDFLIVTGTLGDFGGTIKNRSGEFDWVHSSDRGVMSGLGMAVYQVENAHWMFGQGDVSFSVASHWNLDLQMSLGAGNDGNAGFLYQKYSAKAMYEVTRHIYLKGQEEFIDIGASNGHLPGAGLSFIPNRLFSTDLSYSHSVGGNLRTQFVMGRFDLNFHAVQPFAGFTAGKTAPAIFQLQVGQPTASAKLADGFGGIAVPVYFAKVILAGEWIQIGSDRRASLTCSVKFPIGRK